MLRLSFAMTLVGCISQTRHIAVLCKLGKLVSFADCSLSCALMQDWHSYLRKIQSLCMTFETILSARRATRRSPGRDKKVVIAVETTRQPIDTIKEYAQKTD